MENLKQGVEVDKTTNTLANGQTPPENRETQERSVVIDPLGSKYCLDCAFPIQPETIQPVE